MRSFMFLLFLIFSFQTFGGSINTSEISDSIPQSIWLNVVKELKCPRFTSFYIVSIGNTTEVEVDVLIAGSQIESTDFYTDTVSSLNADAIRNSEYLLGFLLEQKKMGINFLIFPFYVDRGGEDPQIQPGPTKIIKALSNQPTFFLADYLRCPNTEGCGLYLKND